MSIIIYAGASQMADLQRDAEKLRRHFEMAEVQGPGFDPYPLTQAQIDDLKSLDVCFITDISPKSKDYSTSTLGRGRILSYNQALRLMKGE